MKLPDLLGEQITHQTKTCEIVQESLKQDEFLSEESKNEQKKKKKRNLQKEVVKLKGELEDEQALNKALRAMLRGPVLSQPRLSLLLLPPQVQELIEEMATVEAEILCLEKRIGELKIDVYQEKKETDEQETETNLKQKQRKQMHQKRLRRQNHMPCETRTGELPLIKDDLKHRSKSQNYEDVAKDSKKMSFRTVSIGSAAEFLCMSSSGFKDEIDEILRTPKSKPRNRCQVREESKNENPNKISEDMIKCLMGIFLELNRVSREREGSATVSKLSLSHLKSASFKRRAATSPDGHNVSNLDPYGVSTNGAIRDVGAYKDFIHITRSSIDVSRLSDLSTAIVKLRVLIEKLNDVDLNSLTYNQKLAFWINIYNSCIMNVCLEHGLPSSQEKFMALMKKASLNVGGTMTDALDIEKFILRHPFERQESNTNEKATQIQRCHGLEHPEPNLTFALCRGNWSSPALRVYTPEEVLNDLDRARTEFLEASVGILSNKRKILIPELLRWYNGDLRDDAESLLEWICDQLPQSCLFIKETITECLKMEAKIPATKTVEIRPYEYEFRYLLPL